MWGKCYLTAVGKKNNYIFTLTVAKERVATQRCKLNAFLIFLSLQNIFQKMANQVVEINHMMIA